MPKNFDWNAPQGLCLRGVQMIRDRGDVAGGVRLLKAALAADPCFVPALDALASLALRQARHEEATRYAERALAVDTYDGSANLAAGLAALAQNDLPTAKERLGAATFAPELRAAAFAKLSRIALREQDWREALRLSDRALAANALSLDALWSRAVALRKAGRTEDARRFAADTLSGLPLFSALRYEAGKVGAQDDSRTFVRGEFPHETFMDIATAYLEAGLNEEARELLGFAGEHPLPLLWLAFLTRDTAALTRIATLPVAFTFPFRGEMLSALEWAAQENASWKFKWYLALFKAANGDAEDADARLAACGQEPDEATFYLYRAGRRIGAARLADVMEAERRGGGWRAGLMRYRCEADAGEADAALATATRLQKAYPDANAVKLAYAKALLAAKRYVDCVNYLEQITVLPSEFGENATDIWREACYALGENAKAESWPENLGAGKPYPQDRRPYEFKKAKRDTDDVPPLVDFEDGTNWRVVATDAAATCAITQEEQLFGTNTLKLSYCGGHAAGAPCPAVRIAPPEPIALPKAFDTLYVWVKGNHFGRGGNTDFSLPNPELFAVFRLVHGEEMKISLAKITWPDWHQVNRRFTEAERVKFAGATFVGFELSGGTQAQYLQMHFDNLAIFTDDLQTPLDVKPRARRNLKPLAGAVQGINTGEGTLPFPTREETIIPKTSAPKKGDLVAQFNGGSVDATSARDLQITTWRQGRSLVVDFFAPAGKVTEVSAGTACEAKVVKSFTVPYLAYGDGKGRLKIDLLEGGWYRSAVFDWYRSNASLPGCADGAFTMRYLPKTDGTYNPVSERLVITVSRDFAEVLPEIPNPVSPYKAITGKNAWRAHGSFDHAYDRAFWREVKRAGIEHVVVNDHETMWRDRGESFTYRTDAAPGRGGDAGAEAYSRFMRDELDYVYGPYNNYTDFAPMNAYWSRERVSRKGDGSLLPAWVRCYAPKPVFAPQLCEEIVPKAQAKFAFNTAYCDVHTAVTPYSRTDYDARVPGAATFAQTFYAWGELMLLQKKFWGGPVYSEGGRQFFYSGLADGNYAQDGGYDFHTQPWIVDFDVLKIHPLECNFGMGTLAMFSHGKTQEEIRRHRPHTPTEKDRDELIDLFLTATVAFGHAPFLVLDYCFEPSKAFGPAYHGPTKTDLDKGLPVALRSYAMVQPIAARYTQSTAKTIRYFDAAGQMRATSAAIASGDVARNQLFVEYEDGTCVVANGNTRERLKAKVNGRVCDLPPRAFKAWTRDGQVRVEIGEDARGRRTYFCSCPEFTFRDGKLVRFGENGKVSP